MTASALGGIIRFQLIPDFLCECQAVIFVFCLCVEFSCQVSPELHGGRHVPHQPGQEGWRYVAVGAAGANTELIRVMHSMRKLLEWRIHFVAGSAKRVSRGVMKGAEKASREPHADDECEQPANRNSE
jgi:hypothetical protein